MVPVCDKEAEETSTPPPELREYRIQIPSLNDSLLDNNKSRKRRLLDFLKARSPSMEWFNKLRFPSPLKIFRQKMNEREEISISVPPPISLPRHKFHINFIRNINWTSSVFSILKEWYCENPMMNIALSLWLLSVAVSGSMLILLLLGLLNTSFPSMATRNRWIEINNQVLNALFTLMSVYQHPTLIHHLCLLFRWQPEDIVQLRRSYCKDGSGSYRPREYLHIAVVVCLLHVTCFCQYMLCGLYWGFSRNQRPEWAENVFFILGTVTPVVAAVYTICSPLGKEYNDDHHLDINVDQSKHVNRRNDDNNNNVVRNPEWVGGLFDCFDDPTVGLLSCFCTFCVFGWNMDRLGFGNMYVHTVTFILLCIAPFWIFSVSAMHIHDYVIGDIVGVAGILLCAFGLLYGGYWRVQMRKRFGLLSGDRAVFCGLDSSVGDYVKWMFCWGCALAQEVRTGNFYDVQDGRFYRKLLVEEENCEVVVVHQDGNVESEPLDLSTEIKGRADVMEAPIQPLIQLQTEDAN